jgi:hypothetical protein
LGSSATGEDTAIEAIAFGSILRIKETRPTLVLKPDW